MKFQQAKHEFRLHEKNFDKALKKKRRSYNQKLLEKIEKLNTSNLNAFWDYIQKLGPKKDNTIPWEVEINGQTVTDKSKVLSKWRDD